MSIPFVSQGLADNTVVCKVSGEVLLVLYYKKILLQY